VRLAERDPETQAEQNIAGASLAIVEEVNGMRRTALVWGAESRPYTFIAGGKAWAVTLRKERYPMPFAIGLQKFTKEDHPRSNMPRAFSSDVQVSEGSTTRDVRISMNEPLRDRGLVVYQASWGPSNAMPGQRLFSTFAVVRNPADQGPLYACFVIAAGLLYHFSRKLLRFVRLEGRTA
jgi:cytochrome c biogenesis protein ResB